MTRPRAARVLVYMKESQSCNLNFMSMLPKCNEGFSRISIVAGGMVGLTFFVLMAIFEMKIRASDHAFCSTFEPDKVAVTKCLAEAEGTGLGYLFLRLAVPIVYGSVSAYLTTLLVRLGARVACWIAEGFSK